MNENRFWLLEIEMVRRGVALRHARRAALELESHHRDLVEQALARGETPDQAVQSAHAALGSDAVLIERYVLQKELQGWAYRWRAGYVVAPLFGFAGLFAATMASLVMIVSHAPARLHHMRVPGALTQDIDLLVNALFLWVIPVAVGIACGVMANRHRVAFRWPLAGIILLCVVAALVNVQFVVTGGSPPGVAGAGIGFSPARLPHQLLRAAATAALALVPVVWLRYRASARRLSPG